MQWSGVEWVEILGFEVLNSFFLNLFLILYPCTHALIASIPCVCGWGLGFGVLDVFFGSGDGGWMVEDRLWGYDAVMRD